MDIDVPNTLSIDDVDLSIILGNSLDNAIEACTASNSTNLAIDLKMYVNEVYLIIKILNAKPTTYTLSNESIDESFTTKKDKENHGLGLKNIQTTIAQYDGLINLKDQGDTVEIQIAIPK
ncbi:GHKL domain-containing protein [Alkaliphilus metalliredigens]|uniref:GHKL domain-containing protein n=1 Tax=Alkaliphilus metalliredigens TaxID=208226 RepID=UPI002E8DF918|nr:GHKL domain-containing protein [Alkaliphilus metalliredigens]